MGFNSGFKGLTFFLWYNNPTRSSTVSLLRFQYHKQTHNTRSDSSGQWISPSQGPLPDNTQQSQKTVIHAPGGIRNPQSQQASGLKSTP